MLHNDGLFSLQFLEKNFFYLQITRVVRKKPLFLYYILSVVDPNPSGSELIGRNLNLKKDFCS